MAEDLASKDESEKAPWLKIFTAFRIALDPKKLLLAGLGVLATAMGWWACSWVFYELRAIPEANSYLQGTAPTAEDNEAHFQEFKVARKQWNFLHRLAGRGHVPYDEGDLAGSYKEYTLANRYLDALKVVKAPVEVKKEDKGNDFYLVYKKDEYRLSEVDAKNKLEKLVGKNPSPTLDEITIALPEKETISIGGILVKVSKDFDKLKKTREEASKALDEEKHNIEALTDLVMQDRIDKVIAEAKQAKYKPAGEFRAFPFSEYRGPNQYLLVAKMIEESGKENSKLIPIAWVQTKATLAYLLEPLVKFLKPIVYIFHPDGGGVWNQFYLLLITLWTLIVWSVCGGAITRIAVVQVSRDEKVGFMESLNFVRGRLFSYLAAPMVPLAFLAGFMAILWVFGLLLGWTFAVGDVVGALLWPLILVVGLAMAGIVAGLVCWPLMNATLSAEGSDSFDAVSRSYSYVYQVPRHYLRYGVLAMAYGAVLVFFVGFMASLLIYLSKWGISQAPVLDQRDPAFLFMHAPASFGWRDLLLHDSKHAEVKAGGDSLLPRYDLKKEFKDTINWTNRIGIYLVTFWLALFFLLIVGFGYSYFWTAISIIYLLLRQKVDDTDLDEVHLEEDEPDLPFMPERSSAAATAHAPSSQPPGVTFTMVEAPQLRPSSPPPVAAPAVADLADPYATISPPDPPSGEPKGNSPPTS